MGSGEEGGVSRVLWVSHLGIKSAYEHLYEYQNSNEIFIGN
jgi:hypothetical protein